MKLIIEKSGELVSPSLETYIKDKISSLAKFLTSFEEKGEVEVWLEIVRTTKHHGKGDVFRAAADLRLPKKILRAEEYADDARKAVDMMKDTLRGEVEKYKKRFEEKRRSARAKKSGRG